MNWIWDFRKNQGNKKKHHLSFEAASLVFDDPLAASRPDPYPDEERWQTIGCVHAVIVLVAHTYPKLDPVTGQLVGRIISARKATPHERKAYEEGQF